MRTVFNLPDKHDTKRPFTVRAQQGQKEAGWASSLLPVVPDIFIVCSRDGTRCMYCSRTMPPQDEGLRTDCTLRNLLTHQQWEACHEVMQWNEVQNQISCFVPCTRMCRQLICWLEFMC